MRYNWSKRSELVSLSRGGVGTRNIGQRSSVKVSVPRIRHGKKFGTGKAQNIFTQGIEPAKKNPPLSSLQKVKIRDCHAEKQQPTTRCIWLKRPS
jgi:hypothetical protein